MSLRFVVFCIVMIVALLGLNFLFPPKQASNSGVVGTAPPQGQAAIGGPFVLTSHRGERVDSAQFKGKWMLVYFGFSNCPAICPTDLANMSAVLSELNEEELAQVAPIFITIDPERDSVEALATYMENFHPAIVALTGTVEEIDVAKSAYRIYARKVENEMMEGYMMDHSTFTYLMSPDGEYMQHFTHNTDQEVIRAALRRVLQ